MHKLLNAIACALACCLAAAPAFSQSAYPNKPIRMIVPYPPGASTPDIIGRVAAKALEKELRVSVIVENRAGAGGNMGTAYVAKSGADGYTLLMTSAAFATSPALYTNPGFDPIRDFSPVTLIYSTPVLYAISTSLPVASVREFIDYVKKNPGSVKYGSAGIGSSSHLAAELLFDVLGIRADHIPYKGAAQAMPDLISGRIQFFAAAPATVLHYVKEKRMKALAFASKTRMPQLPDVPTVHESAVPNFDVGLWGALLAPAGTPVDAINKLQSGLEQYFLGPEGRGVLDAQMATAVVSKPEAFAAYLKSELELWGRLIKKAGITAE